MVQRVPNKLPDLRIKNVLPRCVVDAMIDNHFFLYVRNSMFIASTHRVCYPKYPRHWIVDEIFDIAANVDPLDYQKCYAFQANEMMAGKARK